jgi:excisionase family DNA binding protein
MSIDETIKNEIASQLKGVLSEIKEHISILLGTNPKNQPIAYRTFEVAEMLKITEWTVRDYISKGKLKAVRNGKLLFVTAESLNDFLNK